jgi:hypothetical protein
MIMFGWHTTVMFMAPNMGRDFGAIKAFGQLTFTVNLLIGCQLFH